VFLPAQRLDTGFKSALGDKARTHVLWAEAVRALQDNVDEFHICHCVFMVTVYSHEQVGFPIRQARECAVLSTLSLYAAAFSLGQTHS